MIKWREQGDEGAKDGKDRGRGGKEEEKNREKKRG